MSFAERYAANNRKRSVDNWIRLKFHDLYSVTPPLTVLTCLPL